LREVIVSLEVGRRDLKAWNSWCLGTSKRKRKEYVNDAFSWEQSPIIGYNCFANLIILSSDFAFKAYKYFI
jgi:hypothetical protein